MSSPATVGAALGAAFALLGFVSASQGSSLRTSCARVEGAVLTHDPSAGRSCRRLVNDGADLYRVEQLHTGTPGSLSFHTNHLYRCIEFADTTGSADVLLPGPGIAVKHVRGKTWCRHLASDPYRMLTAPGVVIRTSGTTFGIDSNGTGSTIKVAEGRVIAISRKTKRKVLVPAGYQVRVPKSGPPKRRRRLRPDGQDQQAMLFLTLGALPSGPAQVLGYLRANGQTSVVIVAEDSASAKNEAKKLPGITTALVTGAEVESDPSTPAGRADKIGAQTAVFVGAFEKMSPLLRLVSGHSPSDFVLVFASP
jgi:hypothetical protein